MAKITALEGALGFLSAAEELHAELECELVTARPECREEIIKRIQSVRKIIGQLETIADQEMTSARLEKEGPLADLPRPSLMN
jgi:hypothetical protein